MEAPQNIDVKKLADGIQAWIVEEYSPMIQEWVMEQYTPSNNEEVVAEAVEEATEAVKEEILDTYVPTIQNWVVEHFAPEVEKWCINEFAPGIQNWIIEEYAPETENWMNESFRPKIENKINETINEAIAESKKSNLTAIDETLKVLEGLETVKPTYSRKALITENVNEPRFVQEMPAAARVKWDLASNEVKESIMRRAKLYNLVNEGAIERFWESIDFAEIKPAQNVYEGLSQIEDERERQIRMGFRNSRFRKNNF